MWPVFFLLLQPLAFRCSIMRNGQFRSGTPVQYGDTHHGAVHYTTWHVSHCISHCPCLESPSQQSLYVAV